MKVKNRMVQNIGLQLLLVPVQIVVAAMARSPILYGSTPLTTRILGASHKSESDLHNLFIVFCLQ